MSETFWNRIKTFFDHPTLGKEPAATEEVKNPLLGLLGPLEAMREKAFEFDETAQRDKVRQDALEEEHRQAKIHQQDMLKDILQLHQRLNTGLAQADLEKLGAGLRDNLKFFSNRNTDSLRDQGMLALLHSIQTESLNYGWQRLNEVLSGVGLEWPRPLGLSPSSSAEDVKTKSDLHREKMHQEFLSSRWAVVSDLLVGLVPAWRSVYPEQGGAVWTETVYQSLGGALAAQRFLQVVSLGMEAADSLRSAIAARLTLELAPVQQHLAQGVSSVAEARSLSDQASEITQKVAAEEFWAAIGPRLQAGPVLH